MHFESPVLDVSKWLITLLCVSFLNSLILKLDLAAIKAHTCIYTFCHIDSCEDDSLYYKTFPYQLNDVGPF